MVKMKKIFWISVLFLQFGAIAGQDLVQIKETQEIIISGIDSSMQFNILMDSKNVDPKLNKIYYWYSKREIHKNRGDYYGSLLHDMFFTFNKERKLIVKGRFKKGLKVGLWKKWYVNGNVLATENWKKGLLHGKIQKYNNKGECVYSGRYRKGEKKGYHFFYSDEGELLKKTRYKGGLKHGKEIIKTDKKELVLKYRKGNLVEKDGKKLKDKRKEKRNSIFNFWRKKDSKKQRDKPNVKQKNPDESGTKTEKKQGFFRKLFDFTNKEKKDE